MEVDDGSHKADDTPMEEIFVGPELPKTKRRKVQQSSLCVWMASMASRLSVL